MVDWYPDRPTGPQVAFGFLAWCGMAALSLYMSADVVGGRRVLLWCMAGMAVMGAFSRVVVAVMLLRESRARRG